MKRCIVMVGKTVGWILLGLFALTGCGGSGDNGGGGLGLVSGVVFDTNGNIVRGATISVDGASVRTFTNSNGEYILEHVPAIDTLIHASINQNGARYVGSNLARVFVGEQAKNVNIVIAQDTQLARVHAVVTDNGGFPLQNARVYALIANNSIFSSSMAVTDANGECDIRDLLAGVDYNLLASGRTYQSAPDLVNLSVGERRTVYFVLGNTSNVTPPVPSNVSATSWTAPTELTRSPQLQGAIEAFKNKIDPRRANRQLIGRSTSGGNAIEVDLYWDAISSNRLLGYGIYRAAGPVANTDSIAYLRDPLASFFADMDDALGENQTYSYQITSLSTFFPDAPPGDESAKSVRVVAHTLGDLLVNGVTQNPLVFNWFSANGATDYSVYLFDQYPGFGIDWIWSSASTGNTSTTYNGPSLIHGKRYYYLVLGTAGSGSRTVSDVMDFVLN